MALINSSKSTCAYSVAITKAIKDHFSHFYCFLAHIQEENNDTEVTFKQIIPTHSIKQEARPAATVPGYLIISLVVFVLLSSIIGLFLCCRVLKKKEQRNELVTYQQQQQNVIPQFQNKMSQFVGSSSTSTEILFVHGDEDSDGDPFCVVSLSMADEKGNILLYN